MHMEYDFSWALQIAQRELAPYFAFREAQAAGVKVESFKEALRWKEKQAVANASQKK